MPGENVGAGQALDPTNSVDGQDPPQNAAPPVAKVYDEGTVKELREESAKWRTQFREAQAAIRELEARAGDGEKVKESLRGLQAQLESKAVELERALKAASVVRLAAKAGVDPDVAALLDMDKIDITDEAKALDVLKRLAPKMPGNHAKPGQGAVVTDSDEALHQRFFGRSSAGSGIFGG